MIASRSIRSKLGEAAAIARLDELLEEWTIDPADGSDADVVVRIERPSPSRATMWTNADGIEVGISISLTPDAAGTSVVATIDSFRVRSRALRPTSRLFRKQLLDGFFDEIEQQFAQNPIERPGRRTEQLRAARLHHDDAARRAERAIDAPGIREALRRRRLLVVGFVVATIVATVCVPVFMGVAQRRHDHLRRTGVDTTAVVTDYRTGKTTKVVFRFRTDDMERFYTFDDPPDTYRVGDEVAVRVLRDGSFLEIRGESFDALASEPAAASMVGALVLASCAAFTGRRLYRHRRDLARHRFVTTPITAYHFAGKGNIAIVACDREHRRLLRLSELITGKRTLTGWDALVDPGRILTAGPPDRTSVALLPPDRVVHVRRSRNPLTLRWWRRQLRRKGHRVDPR